MNKFLKIIIIFLLALISFNATYAQEPATPFGSSTSATKFPGKVYFDGLMYLPVYADTPAVGTLYRPKRNGALILKQYGPDSAYIYTFIGHWVPVTGGGVDLSNYYSISKIDSITASILSKSQSNWDSTSGPSAILNKPTIPAQLNLIQGNNINVNGDYPNLTISVPDNVFIPVTQKGDSNGVATLDANGKIPVAQIPTITLNTPYVVGNQSAMLALPAVVGDMAIRTDINKTYVLQNLPASTLSNWVELLTPGVASTDQVPEGTTNLYFTALRALAAMTGQNISIFNNNIGYISKSDTLTMLNPYERKNDLPVKTASNGLSLVGTDVQLSGTLSKKDTLNGGSNGLMLINNSASTPTLEIINNATAGNYGLRVTTYDATAIYGKGNGAGTGIEGDGGTGGNFNGTSIGITTNSSGIPLWVISQKATLNDVADGIIIQRNVNGTTNGFGLGIRFSGSTSDSMSVDLGSLQYDITSNHTYNTSIARFSIQVMDSNHVNDNVLQIMGSGGLKLNKYGLGNITGTPTYNLQVDASGNVIETSAGISSSNADSLGHVAASGYLTTTTAASTYLPLVGGTMTGSIAFNAATYNIGDATNYLSNVYANIFRAHSYVNLGTNSNVIIGSTATGTTFSSTGKEILFSSTNTSDAAYMFGIYSGIISTTSGGTGLLNLSAGGSFAPTSGTATFNGINFSTTINQTGGANGITRGIYLSPTLTAAADYRAIESTTGSLVMSDSYLAGSGSLAGSLLNLSQTWNTTGAPTAIKLNVTTTASSAASNLMDLQVGGTSEFKVRKDGLITTNSSYGFSSTSAYITGANPGINIYGNTYQASGYDLTISSINSMIPTITVAMGIINSTATFAPTAGAGTFNNLYLNETINQTGGANGITRSLYINPTLTAAADYRAIELTNNTGKGIYQSGTAPNTFGGTVTANSFIIPGGTSSQLLAADGSIINTTAFVSTTGSYSFPPWLVNIDAAVIGSGRIDTARLPVNTTGLLDPMQFDSALNQFEIRSTFLDSVRNTVHRTGAETIYGVKTIRDNIERTDGTNNIEFSQYGLSGNLGNMTLENTTGDLQINAPSGSIELTSNTNKIDHNLFLPNSPAVGATGDSLLTRASTGGQIKMIKNTLRPYKIYTALVGNNGGDSSVLTVTVLENNIGTIVWARSGVGDWTGTLAGAFSSGKTTAEVGSDDQVEPAGQREFLQRQSTDVVHFRIKDATATATDALVSGLMIEIRVYP